MKKSIGAKPFSLPTPVFIVSTYDDNDRANAMNAAWGGVCCSNPPCISVSMRSATYSHSNILSRKAFTVNVPSSEQIREADYFGLVSGRDRDKFQDVGLNTEKSDCVDAPVIVEFPVSIECELKQVVEIGGHTQFIGEVKDIKVDESCIMEDGMIDVSAVSPCLFVPVLRDYYKFGEKLGDAFSVGKEFLAD